MSIVDLFGLLIAGVLVVAIGGGVATRERSKSLRRILLFGLVLRVAGSLGYFGLLETVYGSGDYNLYLRIGTEIVENANDPGGEPVSRLERFGDKLWGTPSISILTSWIMQLLGTGPLAVFVVFGVINYLAALCFVYGFKHAYPDIIPDTYARWVMFFPSLWFWPSPLGKDGPVLFGIALAFLGIVGIRGKRNYVLVALGIFVTLAVRPQYAIVFILALAGGVLLGQRSSSGGAAKLVAVVLMMAGAVYVITTSSELLGFDVTETEETAEWIDSRGSATAYGGSAFDAATDPVTGLVNVLFRPFIWEARGLLVLISAAEVLLLWGLLYRRRRGAAMFVRRYGRTETFWISALFTIALAAAVGMAVGNFGTLVRQRVHIYPFLFLIAASIPVHRVTRFRRANNPRVAAPPAPAPAAV